MISYSWHHTPEKLNVRIGSNCWLQFWIVLVQLCIKLMILLVIIWWFNFWFIISIAWSIDSKLIFVIWCNYIRIVDCNFIQFFINYQTFDFHLHSDRWFSVLLLISDTHHKATLSNLFDFQPSVISYNFKIHHRDEQKIWFPNQSHSPEYPQ